MSVRSTVNEKFGCGKNGLRSDRMDLASALVPYLQMILVLAICALGLWYLGFI